VARLHAAWTRGVVALSGGENELVEFLLERVRTHGGETRLEDRATRLAHRRGNVAGIVIEGDDDVTGVDFVVTDHTTRGLLDLASDFDPPRRALGELPHLLPAERRFVVSIVVRNEGLPGPLADEAFLVPGGPSKSQESAPVVHLQRWRQPCGDPGATLLVAEAMLPEGSTLPLSQAREAVVATVESLLPFVDRHYLVVDSPHDGRPLWDFRGGSLRQVDRATLRSGGASLEAEPMAARWRVDPPTELG
jgi:hypothetical protein